MQATPPLRRTGDTTEQSWGGAGFGAHDQGGTLVAASGSIFEVALPPDTYFERDEQALERSLYSFANALRLREGSILDVERTEPQPRDRHTALIRYEIPLPEWAPPHRRERKSGEL
jgi:hypothetical protein